MSKHPSTFLANYMPEVVFKALRALPVFMGLSTFKVVCQAVISFFSLWISPVGDFSYKWLFSRFVFGPLPSLEKNKKRVDTGVVSSAQKSSSMGRSILHPAGVKWLAWFGNKKFPAILTFVRAIIVLYERIQNKSQCLTWQTLCRTALGSSTDFPRTSSAHETSALHPFGLLQQTKDILRLLLDSLISKTSAGAYAKVAVLRSGYRTVALFASRSRNRFQLQLSSRNAPPLRRQNQGGRAILCPGQGRQAFRKEVLHVLFSGPLGSVNTEPSADVVELENSGQRIYPHYKPRREIVKTAPMGHFAGVPWVSGKKMLLTHFLGVVAGFIFLFLFVPASAQAATLYWVGGAGDNVGTNANDWSTTNPAACADGAGDAGAVPGASDVATFDPDCDSNATIAANWSVAGIDIQSGYIGTLTQNTTNTLTVGSSNYSQADGTFTGGSGAITISGTATFTLSGGTFTSTSGTLALGSTSVTSNLTIFNQTGGTFTHNSGTVSVASGTSCGSFTVTLNVNTSITFNNFTFTTTQGCAGTYLDGSSDTYNIDGTFTMTDTNDSADYMLLNSGTWNAKGNISIRGGHYQAGGVITMNGTGDQTYAFTGTTKFPGYLTINKSSGTVSAAGGTTALAANKFTLTAGSFTAPSGTFTMYPRNDSGSATLFSMATGTTFTHNSGTVTFNYHDGGCSGPSAAITVPAEGVTFNNTTFDSSGCSGVPYTISGATLTVAGTLTQTNGAIHGALAVQGAVAIGSGADGGTATLTYSGTASQTYTDSGGNEPDGDVTINKSSGTVTLASNADWNATSQDVTVTSGTLSLASYTIATAVLTVSSGATLTLQGGETVTATTKTFSSGSTVSYTGTSSYTTALAAGNTYHHLTFNGSGGVWEPDGAVTVAGNLTITAGTFDIDGQNLTVTSTFSNSGTLRLTGGETTFSVTMDTDSGTIEYD